MIERLRRMKNVVCVDYFHMYSNDMLISNTTQDGLPKVEMGAPSEFYERLERDTPTLATWSGEMVFTTYLDHCETSL